MKSLIKGYLAQLLFMLPELLSDSDTEGSLGKAAIGFNFFFMLIIGFLPGPLIKDYLYFVALSFFWHYLLLHFREYWLRSLHMYKSKFTSPPRPRPGN